MVRQRNRPVLADENTHPSDPKALSKGGLFRRHLLKSGFVGVAAGSLLVLNLEASMKFDPKEDKNG